MRFFLALYLPLIVAYGDTFVWMRDRWADGEYYSHGPLLVIVAAAIIVFRRSTWGNIESGIDPRGWWFLGLGLFLRFCGAAQMVDSLSAASLLFSLIGVVLLSAGAGRLRYFLPVIFLLLLATPMPINIVDKLAFELKEVAIETSMSIGNLFGLGAQRIGAAIDIPGQDLHLPVADACGGLRSLLALTSLGYCLAFFMGSPHWGRRLVILLITVPAAVMVNVIRIVGLCFMAKHVNIYYAGGAGHTILNVVAWIMNIAILMSVDAFLERRLRSRGRVD